MRRVVASCFSAYIAAMLAASYLPLVALLPLAAVFVALLAFAWHKRQKNTAAIAAFLMLGLLVQSMGAQWLVRPVQAMENQTKALTVQVVQVQSGFAEDRCNVQLRVLAVDGEAVPYAKRFFLQASLFPLTQLGAIYTGDFALAAIKQDSWYYSNMADRVWLRTDAPENLQQVGQGMDFSVRMKLLQQMLAQNITNQIAKDEGGVLAAMSIGWKGGLTAAVKEDYRSAGVSHILVVSGLHLGILCQWIPGKNARGGWRKLHAILALCMVTFVMALTGFSPSVCRAGVAAIIFYGGVLLRLPPDGFTSLAIAGVVASLGGPYALCDIGLQLSFMATIGVLLAQGYLAKAKPTREQSPLLRTIHKGRDVLVMGVFASVFTMPVLFANNFTISLWAPLVNLFTTLLVAPTVVFGLLAAVCGLVPRLHFWCNVCLLCGGLLAKAMNAITATMAKLPGGGLQVDGGYLLLVWMVVAGLILVLVRLNLRVYLRIAVAGVLCVAALVYSLSSAGLVTISTLGTAGTQCVAIQQNGQTVVVFQGGNKNEKAVLEWMQMQKMDALNLLIDLRQTPSAVQIPTDKILVVSQQTAQTNTTMCDIMVTTLHFGSGNLAVIDVAGFKISIVAGRLTVSQPLSTDIHIAGTSWQQNIQPRLLVAASQGDWHAQAAPAVYYSSEATIQLRPGRAIKIRGGRYAS